MAKVVDNQNSNPNHIEHIKENYEKHLDGMIAKHGTVLQTRFDLKYPNNIIIPENKKLISTFMDNFNKDLKRNNPFPENGMKRSQGNKQQTQDVDPRIIWVREIDDENDCVNYKLLALVNGNEKQCGDEIKKRAEKQWGNILKLDDVQGLVNSSSGDESHSIMINRNSDDFETQRTQAQNQASYLSEERGKKHLAKGTWRFGGTRIPKTNKKDE